MVAVLLLLAAFVMVPAAPAAAIVGVQHVVNASGSDSRNKTIQLSLIEGGSRRRPAAHKQQNMLMGETP